LGKSSSSIMGLAQEPFDARPVNGFHQAVESQSTIISNGSVGDRGYARTRLTRPEAFSSISHVSRAMGEIIDKIERSCDSSAPTLITGETGTGKELIARAVHAISPCREREFIPFNCGGMAPDLIATELFGYRRGAFTGADKDYRGVIRESDGGTLFLDEIGELPLAAQPKMLRFLQEGEVSPLGEARPINVNVRVIAATNRDVETEVRAGRFRADLYWRLNMLRLHIPPLRERREDIPCLIEHFLVRFQQKAGKLELRLSAEARNALLSYHWPGNVRELENTLYRLVTLAESGEEIGQKRILEEIAGNAAPPAAIIGGKIVIDRRLPYHERKNELERLSIIEALSDTDGNLSRAATKMGVSVFGLRKAVKRFGIGRVKDNRQ
jgi:transcriptional regulator with GAF, ATPase, and Fis domain